MSDQIFSGGREQSGRVFEVAKAHVARIAEQATEPAGSVAVVNVHFGNVTFADHTDWLGHQPHDVIDLVFRDTTDTAGAAKNLKPVPVWVFGFPVTFLLRHNDGRLLGVVGQGFRGFARLTPGPWAQFALASWAPAEVGNRFDCFTTVAKLRRAGVCNLGQPAAFTLDKPGTFQATTGARNHSHSVDYSTGLVPE